MCTHSYSLSSTCVGLCIMTAAPSLLADLGHVLSPVWASLSSRFWEELASVITGLSGMQGQGRGL